MAIEAVLARQSVFPQEERKAGSDRRYKPGVGYRDADSGTANDGMAEPFRAEGEARECQRSANRSD